MANRAIATLNDVLRHMCITPIVVDRPILGLSIDSRKLVNGDLFLAVPGVDGDGRRFMRQACQKGAAAIVAEAKDCQDYLTDCSDITVPLVLVDNLKNKLGHLASDYYRTTDTEPVSIIGVTGTNGKTSCCWIISQLLTGLGKPCALLGTLGKGIPNSIESTLNTTPDVLSVHQFIADLSTQGCFSLAMEVSSHGLEQGRVDGVPFDVGIFTNLSRDHLDSYQSMDEYAKAKSLLFSDMSLKHAVINEDDTYGSLMKAACSKSLDVLTFSEKNTSADVYSERVRLLNDGLTAIIHTPWGQYDVRVPLMGRFNLENLLAVIATLGIQEYDLHKITSLLPSLTAVPGRMQRFGGKGKPTVFVDYAHTPSALNSVLVALREHGVKKLICVFGCGGDRDKGKRPLMTMAALGGADTVVLTSDNPRSEAPETIIANAMEGIEGSDKQRITTIIHREDAIVQTILSSDADDVVVIAGKGHETYQEINGVRHAFDDGNYVREALKQWCLL
ncbi:MAG: UDP-N-acetylmuramoyl-L-alanyl-D-glutamate--2,6-diaminopimelate ligase [Endozoicomonas sp. (ex Botrylloides leachii)]|nr:UDP-N-acetylmuramoyl-L-alanyl-D-glutamate--2,6-diaminopimelate ligase [Endozoicomonas sp. (ex Botrylloides leachii)]